MPRKTPILLSKTFDCSPSLGTMHGAVCYICYIPLQLVSSALIKSHTDSTQSAYTHRQRHTTGSSEPCSSTCLQTRHRSRLIFSSRRFQQHAHCAMAAH